MAHRTAPTLAQKEAALAAAQRYDLRAYCLLAVGCNLGLRCHELRQLLVRHVTHDGTTIRKTLTVERRLHKGGRGIGKRSVSTREIPINAEAARAIYHFLAERRRNAPLDMRAPLFPSREGGAISRWQLNRIVKRVMRDAGLGYEGLWGSHSMRRHFGREVYRQSGKCILTAQRALGHRFVSTTQDYLDVCGDDVAEVILSLGSNSNAPALCAAAHF